MIAVRGVWKRFLATREKPLSLKNLLLLRGMPDPGAWVLTEVSFELASGASVGIVGKNGCGKSTLLRLLAGILEPSRGSLTVDGRVAPLLGLGAGFHPDLTGRENIALNASILGVGRRQLRQRFDAIAEFSGLGEHLDAPLRYYSSGMYVRLGFSVAAHLEPDVLLIDEVLSVGDQSFRERCTDRIRALQRMGRTTIIVSHDMAEIETFCGRVLWLADGRVAGDGSAAEIVPAYLASYG